MIQTKRLTLRQWTEEDFAPFAQLNGDPRVMEFFPSVLTRAESDQLAQRFKKFIDAHGWGLWVAELLETKQFIGFIGIQTVLYETPFTPAIEIGWRLAAEHWGKGYATEGAKAALDYAFNTVHIPEIVAFTTKSNIRSQAVMKKIGMKYDESGDFMHPKLPSDHPLSHHVLYRSRKENYGNGI